MAVRWVPLLGLALLSACATGIPGGRGHYAQSCMTHPLACSPMSASGELLVPTTVVRTAEAVRGLLTLKDFLDEVEVARVEAVLVQCAKEADFKINEQEYGRGHSPSDAECNRVIRYDSNDEPVYRSMELGTMKHAAAFACVQRELGPEFSEHFTREPRYGKKPPGEEYALTEQGTGSLVPDIVLHLVRDANKIQFLYDFFFPCTSRSKSDPLASRGKLDKYKPLAGNGRRALVTPQLGISR
ncbi:MAG TPA: hypothetical protein VE057_23805 [Archangium sp.]|nr:hypothetical protein [Archangium sp.]